MIHPVAVDDVVHCWEVLDVGATVKMEDTRTNLNTLYSNMHLMSRQYSNVDSILVMQYHIVDRDVVVMDYPVHWNVVDISSIRGGRVW